MANSDGSSSLVNGGDQSNIGAADVPQSYYPDTTPSQMQPSIPVSSYNGNYQQSFALSYDRGYPPAAYPPAPQHPNMFVPSPAPPDPQQNFAPVNVAPQPAARPFVPSTPPVLRNADQYQQPQPATLAAQLYPVTTTPAYNPIPPGPGLHAHGPSQGPSVPGHKMPQVGILTPTPIRFMPVNNPAAPHRNGVVASMQPPSPTQAAPVQQAVAPPAPPPTVQTADTSNVPAHQKPVIATLSRLFNETSEASGGSRANPAKKREIEDNSRKIGALFAKLNSGDISKNAANKLVHLCQALDNNDYDTALKIQVLLTTSEWDECNFWLTTLKRMIKTRLNAR
jgi:protein transport protein SEC31